MGLRMILNLGKTVTKDAGNMSLEDLVSWAEEEAAMSSKASDVDICVTSVLDKGKGLADKGKGLADKGKGIMVYEGKAGRKTARSRNNGIVIGENVNLSVNEDDDSDSDIEWEQMVKGNAELEEMYVGELGEKYVDAAQLKECLTYYALAIGFSLWLYRSSKEMIIARRGRRHEKLKSVQKGKQRKHLK
ncbi:hypothetical protein Tco_0068269 [Tanacetum coccineum]